MTPPTLSRLLHAAISALAAVTLLAAAPIASAQPLTKLRVSTIPIIDIAPLQVGIVKGFFAAEGLEIDTTPTTGGAAGLPALAAGQVQITFSNIISIVLGAKQGLGFEVIAAGSTTGDTAPDQAALVAKKGHAFKTGKDLEGKRVAVNTRNNIIWLYARAWVQATGGNPDNVTYLEVPFPQMIDAVKGDRVDAAFVVEPFLSSGIRSDAVAVVAYPYHTVQKRIPIGQYAALSSYIQQNPQVIERFVRAYLKSVDWVNANAGSDELVKIISGYTRLPPEVVKSMALVPFEKTVDVAAVGQVVDLMRQHKMIEGAFDPKSIFHKTAVK